MQKKNNLIWAGSVILSMLINASVFFFLNMIIFDRQEFNFSWYLTSKNLVGFIVISVINSFSISDLFNKICYFFNEKFSPNYFRMAKGLEGGIDTDFLSYKEKSVIYTLIFLLDILIIAAAKP